MVEAALMHRLATSRRIGLTRTATELSQRLSCNRTGQYILATQVPNGKILEQQMRGFERQCPQCLGGSASTIQVTYCYSSLGQTGTP